MLLPERVDESFIYELDDTEVRELSLTPTNEFEVVQQDVNDLVLSSREGAKSRRQEASRLRVFA